MNIPCSNPPQPCVDPAEPVLNWSSEQPDRDSFYGYDYDNHTPDGPPLGRDWQTTSCLGICVSTISQEDADICAANASLLCLSNNTPGFHQTIYYSAAQSCTVHCPDGSEFTYTVPYGQFTSLSQATANAIAHSYACNQAHLNLICVGTLTSECCVGSAYSSRVSIPTLNPPLTITIISGSLPAGLIMVTDPTGFTIQGIPTTSGSSSFTVRATDTHGNSMTKALTICVVDILGGNPSDATEGAAYFWTFLAPSCAASPRSWQVVSGALPPGIVLDEETGDLSGSATEVGTFNFTIGLSTSAT